MSENPVQIIIAAFNSPAKAGEVMAELKAGKKEGLLGIIDAAVVVKDAEGKLKVTDSKRRSTKGFVTGGVIGGVVGLLAGPVGWVALGGGAIGALLGKVRGAPLKREMTDIGDALTPNSSAIVAVIEHTWVSQLEAAMAAEGAKIVRDEIKADIAGQLNAGGNVLYTVISGENADGAARIAETKDSLEVTRMVATDEGVLLTDAVITAETPEETPAPKQIDSAGGEKPA
jgi:uncharacterized membrane protein